MNPTPDGLLAAIATYGSIIAVFFGIITVVISIVSLIEDRKLEVIITTVVFSLRFPGIEKTYNLGLTIRSLMRICIVVSTLSTISLLGLVVAEHMRWAMKFVEPAKQVIGGAQILALFLFMAIALYIPLIIFEFGQTKSGPEQEGNGPEPEDYSPDIEI
ncbi:hypothetical protein MJD09_17610 [bacterium]|nr:hypothetical protein [bacterium]